MKCLDYDIDLKTFSFENQPEVFWEAGPSQTSVTELFLQKQRQLSSGQLHVQS